MNLSDYLRKEGALSISRLREMIGAKSDNQIRRSLYMVHLHGEVSGLPERFVKYLKKLRMTN